MGVYVFGIEKEFLRDLLRQVRDGHAQLPEFQRGWVWPDRNIASLLASISMGYPVGTRDDAPRLGHRAVQAAPY